MQVIDAAVAIVAEVAPAAALRERVGVGLQFGDALLRVRNPSVLAAYFAGTSILKGKGW